MDLPECPQFAQRCRPDITNPARRHSDVVMPQLIPSPDHEIDPDLCSRIEEDRPSPTPAIEDIDLQTVGRFEIDVVDRLRRAEGQRRSAHRQHPDRTTGLVGDAVRMEPTGITLRPDDVPTGHGRRLPTGDTVLDMTIADHGHLRGRSIIVTGAASGFGRLVTEIASARGADVLAADIDGEGVDALAAELRAQGRSVQACTVDVVDPAQTRAMASACVAHFGSIDVLVNNAGIMPLAFWADHAAAIDAWSRCIDINLKGVMHGIAAVHDQMIDQGRGQIVNISSIYGNVPVAGSAIYTATKAAVNVLSESLRIESQGRIKVTTVKPTGVIGTKLGDSIINGDAMIGILGQNMDSFRENAVKFMTPGGSDGLDDPDDIRYWAISPTELAEQIIYVIDQPWGVSISDITVRASGDQYLS